MKRNGSFTPAEGRGLSSVAQLWGWWLQTSSLWPMSLEEWWKWKWVHSAWGCLEVCGEKLLLVLAVPGPNLALHKTLNHGLEACYAASHWQFCLGLWITWVTHAKPRLALAPQLHEVRRRCREHTELAGRVIRSTTDFIPPEAPERSRSHPVTRLI